MIKEDKYLENIKKYVNKSLLVVTITLFTVLITVTTWQVISRYILHNPSTITEEFIRYGLVWLSMLAAAYAVGTKSHIAITLLSERLKDTKKVVIDIFIQFGFLLFAIIIMFYGGIRAVILTMAQISPSLNLPMGFVYLALPVSGILIILYSSINIIQLFKSKKYVSNVGEKNDL